MRCAEKTSVKRVIVFRRAGNEIHMEEGRDVWWHRELEYVDANCPPAPLDSEHPLYILYTSGSTGNRREFCTRPADIWSAFTRPRSMSSTSGMKIFTGARPTSGGSPVTVMSFTGRWRTALPRFMYEGAPNWPEPDRFWKIIEEIASTFFIPRRPRSARSFAGAINGLKKHDLSSLRLLGTWANRSIPKHGCGITKKSAAAGARSSTPGGKPKPARS